MDLSSNIKSTLLRLCGIKSTSGTYEEALAAEAIYSLISEIEYFRQHSDKLILHDISGDPYGRKYITALYEHNSSKNLVVLLSHFDVVGIDDFGHLRDYALNPEMYTERLRQEDLPQGIKMDLDLGQWLFGRGTADMKCGLAIHIEILRYLYKNNIDTDGSILLLTVPDEENSSAGMLSAAEYLSFLKDSGYNISAVINCEPSFQETIDDNNMYIYTGTMGKLLLTMGFAGVETHAGSPFAGISSSLISSMVTMMVEVNNELCERHGGTVTPPPICLKQQDVKELYSISTPAFSYAIYNYISITSSPDDVLTGIKRICSEACGAALEKMKKAAEENGSLSGRNVSFPYLKFNILTYSELVEHLIKKGISVDNIRSKYRHNDIDSRDATAAIISDMIGFIPELRPAVIISPSPPYYPHRSMAEGSKTDRICKKIIERSETLHGHKLIHKEFFPGLCDLSYLGFENPDDYYSLKSNMPVLDLCYHLPYDALSDIDIEGINISVMGRDIHKYTERVNMPYSFNVTPDLVLYAIKEYLS